MKKMLLSEIAKAVSGTLKGEDREIFFVSTDTRTLEKDSLFVCIKGENFNAHLFAEKAAENGAVCVMAEEEVQCLLWEKYASWCFQRSEGVRAGLRDSNLTAGGYRKQLQADFLST